MIKWLPEWLFGGSKEPPETEDIYQKIIEKIGADNELTDLNFIPVKARSVLMTATSKNLVELQELLIESAVIVSKQVYFPANWSGKYSSTMTQPLDTYISDGDEILHPFDWVENHRHFIIKLVDAVLKMDRSEREYYQRFINFIIVDILNLLNASKECVR